MEQDNSALASDNILSSYIRNLPRELYPQIISDSASAKTQPLVNKELLENAKIDFYYDIMSSITFDDISKISDQDYESGYNYIFLVYDYETIYDEEEFRVSEYVQYYDPHEYFSRKGEFFKVDGYEVELLSPAVRIVGNTEYDYDIKYIKLIYEGSDYYFDLHTLNEILLQKGIPLEIRKELLKLEYYSRLEQFEDHIPYYLYAVNFLLFNRDQNGVGEWDISASDGDFDDINEIIPDYDQKIDQAKFLIDNWIDTLK